MTDGRVQAIEAYQAKVTMCLHYTFLNVLIRDSRLRIANDTNKNARRERALKLAAGFVYTRKLIA
jgi:hypothetical protein